MKLLNISPLLLTFAAAQDSGKCDNFTGAQYEKCIRGRSSTQRFAGWIGPMSYDGVELIAVGADAGSFGEVLPGPTLGCTVYQPAKGWGFADFQSICQLVNSVGQINTDCDGFDPDSNGGMCNNYQMLLSYENWGVGESTGPDIWANSATWVEDTAPVCNPSRSPCTFPSYSSSPDCKAVAHTWSVMVYACSDFNSADKTQAPSTTITCPASSGTASVCDSLADLVYGNLGKLKNAWDAYMTHGCFCPALAGNSNFGVMSLDTMDGYCDTWTQCANAGSGGYTLEFDGSSYTCTGGDIAQCECDLAAVNSISTAAVTTAVPAVQGDCIVSYPFTANAPNMMVGQCSLVDTTGVSDHGCWCQVSDGGAALRGKPLDDLDIMCSKLSKCMKCAGDCSADYNAASVNNCADIVCTIPSKNNACQETKCECIKTFAIDLDAYLTGNTVDASLNSVDPTLCVRNFLGGQNSC